MKQYKNQIIIGLVCIIGLLGVYWWGGDAPSLHGWQTSTSTSQILALKEPNLEEIVNSQGSASITPITANATTYAETLPEQAVSDSKETPCNQVVSDIKETPFNQAVSDSKETPFNQAVSDIKETSCNQVVSDPKETPLNQMVSGSKENKDNQLNKDNQANKETAESIPVNQPLPVEPQEAVITQQEKTCTLSIRCDTILQNMADFDPEKVELVPRDGVILDKREVIFYEGESVFDVLSRETKRNKIHLEFQKTPIYNSAYIEGIANLYEFDCGQLSGWMYKVNGWFPNYGCSCYQLKEGDQVEWLYTCDLGEDLGNKFKGDAKSSLEKNGEDVGGQ